MFPPDQQQQAPPDLAALLGGGAGGAQSPQDAQGAPSPSDPLDLLKNAIQALQDYVQSEPDDINSEAGSKALAQLYRILATEQKNSEQAMGVTPAHKAMRRGY